MNGSRGDLISLLIGSYFEPQNLPNQGSLEGSTPKTEGLSQVPYHFPSTEARSWRSFLSSEHRRMVDEFQVRARFLGWLVGWGANFRSRFSRWLVVSGADLVKCNYSYLVGGFKWFFFNVHPFSGWKIPILKF